MAKRRRFIITSVLLSLGFIGLQFLPPQYRFLGIGTLGVLTLSLFTWSLKEGLGLNATLLTLILPVFYTLGVGLFWFLLPANIYTRIPVVIVYGIGMYFLCLTLNIYTVGVLRTIALLRTARGVGFVLTLLTLFLVYDTIFSLKTSLYITAPAAAFFSFPLFLQGFWSIPLETKLSKDMVKLSVVAALVMGEMALSLYFWPVTVVVGSLFLTVAAYMLLGLGQAKLEGKLFPQTAREYLLMGAAGFIGMYIVTRWGS